MATFSDDFNRADNNSLGSAWTTTGTATIVSNQAKLANTATMFPTGYVETGDQSIQVAMRSSPPVPPSVILALKADSDFQNGWYAWFSYNVPGVLCAVRKRVGGGDTNVNGGVWNQTITDPITYKVVTEGGYFKVYVNNDLVVAHQMDAYSGNGYYFVMGTAGDSYIDSYNSSYTPVAALTVSPDPIPNLGSNTVLTFTGENTAWEEGQPGSPTLECDHGTLMNQVISSETSATVVYDPGEYLGTVRFTDPDSGAYYDAVVSSDVSQFPGGGTQLSTEVIAWLEAQAAQGGLVLADSMTQTEAGAEFDLKTILFDLHLGAYKDTATINTQAATSALLYLLYRNLSGYTPIAEPVFDLPTTDTPVKVDTEQTLQRLKDLTAVPAGDLTLSAMVDLLGGDPFASHHTLLEAIQATDSQAVLDAIAALQGAEGATVDGAIQLIQAMSTIAGYDLADVLTAIAGVRGSGNPDLAAVMTKLSQVQPSTAYTLSSVNTQNVDLKQLLDTLALVIGIVAPEAGTVAELIALIYDAVTAEAPAATNQGPPVWIDEEHATIDSPIALSDGLLLEGPMDGVIVTITGSPSGATKFTFGDTDSWRYVGAVLFETDRGDAEWSQPIGLEAQIITPRTMQHASAARFRVSSGWTGTVSAFTVTAGA